MRNCKLYLLTNQTIIYRLAKNRSEAIEIRGSAKGIAAKTPILYDDSKFTITPYRDNTGKVIKEILPPCSNCAYLMGVNYFNVARFKEGLTI